MLNIRTLLFEDVAKSKKILRELNIPESDPRYQKLKKLLEKNIGYLGLFTTFMFKNRVEYDELVSLYDEIKREPAKFKKLPKPLIQYSSYVELQDALTEVEKDIKFQKAYKMLPKNVRELIDNNLSKDVKDKLISLSDDFIKAYDFLSKSQGKSPEQIESDKNELNKFYSGFATITRNQGDVSDILNKIDLFVKKYADQLSFEKKVEEIKNTDGAEIITANPQTKIIVAAIYTYNASKKLGSPYWCISYSNSHWNENTNGRIQFFIWNYNYPVSDKNNLLGLTLNTDFTLNSFQNSLNKPVNVNSRDELISYLSRINIPVELIQNKIQNFNRERNKFRLEEIERKNVNEITQRDIYFLIQNYYSTPEEIIDFLAKKYDRMPRFALPIILEMRTGDKKKIIPDIISKFKGKFVDEDDFYFMINTDNLRRIYPESDPEKFRDAIIAKLTKERNPKDIDKSLAFSYIIHNLGRLSDAIKYIGVDKLKLFDNDEIMLLLNRAIIADDSETIKLLNSVGRLPNFKPKDILGLIYSLYNQGYKNAYQKIVSLFGDSFVDELDNNALFTVIINYPDEIFIPMFEKNREKLFDKLTPSQIQIILKSENAERLKNFKGIEKTNEPDQEDGSEFKDDKSNYRIYSELIRARTKSEIISIINKYGKSAIRQLEPAQVVKILKNTTQKKLLADTFGKDLVQKAINDPTGGSTLQFLLNREKLSIDNIAESNHVFELFPTLKNNDLDDLLNSKEFQVNLVYDIINLRNIHNINYEKSSQTIIDKYADYSWNSNVQEFEFDYDFNGKIVSLKIWIDNNEPVFMDSTGTRFRMDWLNTEKGSFYKKLMLSKLNSI